jgi:hypothetical protein
VYEKRDIDVGNSELIDRWELYVLPPATVLLHQVVFPVVY